MVICMTEWVDSDVPNWVGMLRFRHPHAEQTENLLEDAEQTINQMEQKDANQSDVCTLRGFLYMVRIVQNPRMVSVTI
jgi:hypothetical protein